MAGLKGQIKGKQESDDLIAKPTLCLCSPEQLNEILIRGGEEFSGHILYSKWSC